MVEPTLYRTKQAKNCSVLYGEKKRKIKQHEQKAAEESSNYIK